MKKNILYFTIIAIMLAIVGCSKEQLLDGDKVALPNSNRTFTLNATIPSTRIALDKQEDNRVSLTWEKNDVIKFIFVQEQEGVDVARVGQTTIDEAYDGQKSAQFTIPVHDDIEIENPFTLYGVYGNVGFSDNPRHLILPSAPETAGSLDEVQDREHVVLYFPAIEVDLGNPDPVTVAFQHLGSLFSVTLKNSSGGSLENIGGLRITGPPGGEWVYNSGEQAVFDITKPGFAETPKATNYMAFEAPDPTLLPGQSMEFWGWYPPHPTNVWPDLTIELYDTGKNLLMNPSNERPNNRTEATQRGRSYYFFSEWNGTELLFSNPTDYAHEILVTPDSASTLQYVVTNLATGLLYSDRTYTLTNIPEKYFGWQMATTPATAKLGGTIEAKSDGKVYIMTRTRRIEVMENSGWIAETPKNDEEGVPIRETTANKDIAIIWSKTVEKGDIVTIPGYLIDTLFGGFTPIAPRIILRDVRNEIDAGGGVIIPIEKEYIVW